MGKYLGIDFWLFIRFSFNIIFINFARCGIPFTENPNRVKVYWFYRYGNINVPVSAIDKKRLFASI